MAMERRDIYGYGVLFRHIRKLRENVATRPHKEARTDKDLGFQMALNPSITYL
jgi:hypothetical protein